MAFPSRVSPDWLSERMDDPGVKVLDASWFLPSMGVWRLGGTRTTAWP